MEADPNLKENRYTLAVEATDDGFLDWDLQNNRISYSPHWKNMLGYHDSKDIGNSPTEWFERLHPDDLEKFQRSLENYLQGKNHHFKAEYRIRHEQGHYLWMLCRGCAVWDRTGKPIYFVCFQTDITLQKKKEEQLFYDAFHDPLTGLSNRALFIDHLKQAIHSRTSFAVLYMDMDYFKEINDRLGHGAGDELLVITARRLEKCGRVGDTIARIGGDEFALLLYDIENIKKTEKIVKRIISEINKDFLIEGKPINTHITIGVAFSSSSGYKNPEQIMRDADFALYQAKNKRKGGYAIFNEKMRRSTASHLKLETDLRNDIKKGKIVFYYQTIVDIKSKKAVGLEALLRWEHEQYGVLKPENFLALAAEIQLIGTLEKVALDIAHKQFKRIRHIPKREMFIAFNISEQQLREKYFVKILKKIIQCPEINPSLFHLEISERTLINNPDYMEAMLKKIKSFGFMISLDGFGTGYSSLTYLHRYPFDCVKIAPSCIIDIEKNSQKEKLIKNIIQVAHSLGITVIAEGVETANVLKMLSDFQCDYAQGFYFSSPKPIQEILNLV